MRSVLSARRTEPPPPRQPPPLFLFLFSFPSPGIRHPFPSLSLYKHLELFHGGTNTPAPSQGCCSASENSVPTTFALELFSVGHWDGECSQLGIAILIPQDGNGFRTMRVRFMSAYWFMVLDIVCRDAHSSLKWQVKSVKVSSGS